MAPDNSGSSQPSITLYTSESCHWCRVAKRHMDDHGLLYTEVDIVKDLKGRREMVRMTGQHGVPVIKVGHRAMTGWDEAEFAELLRGEPRRR